MTATPQHMANAIRALAMDAVQAANSGHPGMPMGMAEIAVALWSRHLKHNPRNPQWPNRDRFVLSNGHGSMLLYALLHLTGYDLAMDDLRQFRQLHSRTPGHPEVGITPGVETTTGPLGQGIANAVGMALAERLLAAQFNEPEFPVVDHHTFVFLGDGCLMEGISHEACALAGTLRLSKLIVLYDDNGISIDGQVQPWFSDNTPQRFAAYGWNVIADVDGHNIDAVDAAIAQAKRNAAQGLGPTFAAKPTLICCKTNIGQGSPALAGSDKVHGAPLGQAEIAATRAAIGWPHAPFEMPPEVYQAWDAQVQGAAQEGEWQALWAGYQAQHPAKAAELQRRLAGDLPQGFVDYLQQCVAEVDAKAETIATRKASQNAIAKMAAKLPELLGGSADLTGSNLTNWPGCGAVRATAEGFQAGAHINWGVREFGMAAALNGVALHGGFIPFGGTFLTFSDYSRNALRMAALMKQRVVHVFTHDSIGLGEDGPTHQPVEHAASLRLIPGLDVWRPADAVETMVAWGAAVQRGGHSGGHSGGPTALLLSRQNLRHNPRSASVLANIAKGAYVLADSAKAQVTLLACGSELELAVAAHAALAEQGVVARVVSMPSTTVFDRQEATYQKAVLGTLPMVVVDAGVPDGWYKYLAQAGVPGTVLGMTTFGESAPAPALYHHFGLTAEAVVQAAEALL